MFSYCMFLDCIILQMVCVILKTAPAPLYKMMPSKGLKSEQKSWINKVMPLNVACIAK